MIEYQYANDKGDTKKDDLISNPFGFGNVDRDFTGSRVVETATEDGAFTPVWDNVVEKAFYVKDNKEVAPITDGATAYKYKVVRGTEKMYTNDEADIKKGDRVAYVYDNVVVPQAKLPMIKAEMKSIALVAKARRIAVYYSQIAA